jgi:ABC-type antimicrobial peptide transport system permease subunit
MKESLLLAGAGIAAGAVAASTLGRFAAGLLYGIAPRDPISLVAASAIMLGVASIAAFLPARRAALVDPVKALRTE